MRNWDARRRSVTGMAWELAWGMAVAMISGMTWSSSAVASEVQAAVPPAFLTCYDIKPTGERLACYDRAVEYLKTGDEAAAPSAETSFGLQARETRKTESSTPQSEQTESVTGRVSEVSGNRDRVKTITLDNGQVWRQVDGSSTSTLRVGDEVTISRAALGSFLMSIPTGRPLRVRRIQ